MLIVNHDARAVATGTVLRPDACVVGAGPAGISTAITLARAGVRTLLIDSGGRDVDPAADRLSQGDSVGLPYYPLHDSRRRGFGGTSLHWGRHGRFRGAPYVPLDFEARPGVPYSGWPIGRADLDAFYARAMRWCGLGPWDFSVKRWETDDRRALDFVDDTIQTVIFQLAEPDVWQQRYTEATTTDNLDLLLNGTVVELRADADGTRIERLRVVTPSGSSFEIASRTVVLALGGIENARMLLLSRDRHPRGLGNEHDLVGRFFQEHLAVRGGIIRSDNPHLLDEMRLYHQHNRRDDAIMHAKLVVDPDLIRERRLLNTAFFVKSMPSTEATEAARSYITLRRALTWQPRPAHLRTHAVRVARDPVNVARTAWQLARGRRVVDTMQLLSIAEQAPNPDSRILLHPSERDAFGLPRPRLDWRLTDLDRSSLVQTQEIVDGALQRSGVGWLERRIGEESPPTMMSGHWHHMGTTRMADDPRHGVVDRHCRVHGLANLYVAGSSTFPTGGYANPTLTIVAMALRLAEHLQSALTD